MSQYISIKNPCHKQSEKACICFKTRRTSTCDYIVIKTFLFIFKWPSITHSLTYFLTWLRLMVAPLCFVENSLWHVERVAGLSLYSSVYNLICYQVYQKYFKKKFSTSIPIKILEVFQKNSAVIWVFEEF